MYVIMIKNLVEILFKNCILQSIKICLSAYANNWWNNNKNFNHSLLIIMARTQLPLIITVGNIMDLSLQNFVRVRIHLYIKNDY